MARHLVTLRDIEAAAMLHLEGKTLNEIAATLGVARETIRMDLIKYDLYAGKGVPRELERIKRKEIGAILAGIVNKKIRDIPENEREPHRLTVCYLREHPKVPLRRYDAVRELVTRYITNRDQKKVVCLDALSEGLDLGGQKDSRITATGKILNRMNLNPLSGKHYRAPNTSDDKKKRVLRAADTQLANPDISYFAGAPEWTAEFAFKDKEIERKPKQVHSVSYRIASEIYQARDRGYFKGKFSADAGYILGIKESTVERALKHEKEIGSIIMDALRKMYPEAIITKPYVTKANRTSVDLSRNGTVH